MSNSWRITAPLQHGLAPRIRSVSSVVRISSKVRPCARYVVGMSTIRNAWTFGCDAAACAACASGPSISLAEVSDAGTVRFAIRSGLDWLRTHPLQLSLASLSGCHLVVPIRMFESTALVAFVPLALGISQVTDTGLYSVSEVISHYSTGRP